MKHDLGCGRFFKSICFLIILALVSPSARGLDRHKCLHVNFAPPSNNILDSLETVVPILGIISETIRFFSKKKERKQKPPSITPASTPIAQPIQSCICTKNIIYQNCDPIEPPPLDPDTITTRTYKVTRSKKKRYTTFSGNKRQHTIHKQIVKILNKNFSFRRTHRIKYLHRLADVVDCSAHTAHACNQEHEYEHSYALIEFAKSVLNIAKETGKFLCLTAQGVFKGTWGVASQTALLATQIATAPIETSQALLSSISHLTDKIVRASWLAFADSNEFIYKVADKIKSLETRFNNLSYEAKVVQTACFVTEFLFPVAATKVRVLKNFKQLKKAVKKVVKHNPRGTIAPAFLDSYEFIKSSVSTWTDKKIHKATQRAILKSKGCSEIIDIGTDIIDCSKLVKANERWSGKGLLHVCKGNYKFLSKKGLKSGLHTEQALNHFLKMCNFDKSRPATKVFSNGVKIVKFPEDYFISKKHFKRATGFVMENGKKTKWKGIKTLFPGHYTPMTIRKSGQEIISKAKNFLKSDSFGNLIFEGRDKEKVNIRMVLNNKNRQIVTIFPKAIQ